MKKYINKHFKEAARLLEEFADKGGANALHGLRVELKKIRALCRFLKLYVPHKKFKKINGPVKKIFSLCGELRDAHVIEKLFLGDHLRTIYKDLQTRQALEKAEKKLQKKAEKFEKKLKEIKEEFLADDAINNDEIIKNYIENLRLTLEERISIQPPRQYWHDVRKQMKQCLYASAWTDKKIIAPDTLKKYDALQHLIGKWHDETLYEQFLDALKKNYKGNTEFIAPLNVAIRKNKKSFKLKEKEIKEQLATLTHEAVGSRKTTFTDVLPT